MSPESRVRNPESGVWSRNILARLQEALWRFQRALGRLQKVLEGFLWGFEKILWWFCDDCAAGNRGGPVLRPAGPVVRSPESGVQSRNILARLQEALWRFQRALGRLQKVLEGFWIENIGFSLIFLIFEAQGGVRPRAWHGRARILGPPNTQKLNTEKPNTEHWAQNTEDYLFTPLAQKRGGG